MLRKAPGSVIKVERFPISQDLGAEAQGCRLDPRGLADVTARLEAAVDGDFDLLVLNKFGKAEAEGGGLRGTFAQALSAGRLVLSSVREPYLHLRPAVSNAASA